MDTELNCEPVELLENRADGCGGWKGFVLKLQLQLGRSHLLCNLVLHLSVTVNCPSQLHGNSINTNFPTAVGHCSLIVGMNW